MKCALTPARVLLGVALVFWSSASRGQEAVRSRANLAQMEARFAHGSWEVEDVIGAFFLFHPVWGGNNRPVMDSAIDSLRIGWMVNDPAFTSVLRGNLELLGEGFGGPIFHGPGNVVAGGTLFCRYNFIQPNARVVPYFQSGGGFVYSDYVHGAQGGNAVSLDVNFNLQTMVGLRFNMNSRWSVLVEGCLRHISNAGVERDANYGIDQAGGNLGMALSF